MDPVANPYSPGAGLRPRELAGRDREIERFDVLRRRAERALTGRSIVMTGLRGVGKTVLLNELADRARREGWIVGKVEADRSGSGRPFREQVARTLNRALREATSASEIAGRIWRPKETFTTYSHPPSLPGGLPTGNEL